MEEMSKQSRSRPATGPGKLLGETRCQLGLEPDNVAQILHLSVRQIEALEADDYDSLPGPTYVRGYLRSYCQLLNIQPDSVIDSYNEAIGGWKTTTYSGLAVERQISSNDNIVRLGTLGVIGVIFGLAIIWWFGEDDTPTVVPAPTEVAALLSTGNEDISANPVVEVPAAEKAPAAVVPIETTPAETPEAAKPVEPVSIAITEETPKPQPEKDKNTRQPTRVEKATTLTATIAKTSPIVVNGARAKLVLRTDGTSWADIRDANDNKLLYESVAAGRVITVEGEAPLQVFLGNANVVSLELDGVAYDFSQFKRGLTARFSVGGPVAGNSE